MPDGGSGYYSRYRLAVWPDGYYIGGYEMRSLWGWLRYAAAVLFVVALVLAARLAGYAAGLLPVWLIVLLVRALQVGAWLAVLYAVMLLILDRDR